MSTHASWGLAEGDAITPELTALKRLGGGNAYEAFLAFDEITFSPVVVKVVRPDQVRDETTLRGLRREAAQLAEVVHPVVVRALRHDADAERPHLVLEHVEGPRLSSLIRRYGALQEQQYLPLAIDVAAALHYFGHVGVTHLDIKPSNVIMGSPARLIDLSVARPAERAAALTVPIGTDAYMAPEQADPGGRYGVPCPASDVWGLGSTLFHAVAGERPFRSGSADDPHPQLVEDPRPLPDGVPVEVAKVLGGMLERDPRDRPLPAEVSDLLAPVLERQPRARLSSKLSSGLRG